MGLLVGTMRTSGASPVRRLAGPGDRTAVTARPVRATRPVPPNPADAPAPSDAVDSPTMTIRTPQG
ncbi:hypothetical protein ACFV0C_24120 [Streptomyces sp. NPDC059568]|uniref:hypothetical protein n=1 Tax=Streptomyces sp. NPDC059568 TaxID=3346868 RepID=UPI003686572A